MKRTPNRRHFGEQVAALIAARGLTLREVSVAAGIPLTTLHRRLNSAHPAFNLGELHSVARILGTSAGAIVTEWETAA
jgi:predicted transcriptional regulator